MTTDWRSWRRRVFIPHTSPIFGLEERYFVTRDVLLRRTATTLRMLGLPTVNLFSLSIGKTAGDCTSNLSIPTHRNSLRRQPWEEAGYSRERPLRTANGISVAFGPRGRVLNTPQSLFRSCEFQLPAERQKQYCSSRGTPMFPAPGHPPTRV